MDETDAKRLKLLEKESLPLPPDPFAYLRDVLTRLPAMTTSQLGEATPAAWAKQHNAGRRCA